MRLSPAPLCSLVAFFRAALCFQGPLPHLARVTHNGYSPGSTKTRELALSGKGNFYSKISSTLARVCGTRREVKRDPWMEPLYKCQKVAMKFSALTRGSRGSDCFVCRCCDSIGNAGVLMEMRQ